MIDCRIYIYLFFLFYLETTAGDKHCNNIILQYVYNAFSVLSFDSNGLRVVYVIIYQFV